MGFCEVVSETKTAIQDAAPEVAEIKAALGRISALTNGGEKTLTFTVPAELWRERLALKAEIAAREKRVKEIDAQLNLPKGDSIAETLSLKEGEKARIILVNGNGSEIGKASVFFQPEKTVASFWVVRYS